MSCSQKKNWLRRFRVIYSFLQVGSEAVFSSCKDSPGCVYLETHDSFCRTTENIRGEPGLHSARPCRDIGTQGQKLCVALATVNNLFHKAGRLHECKRKFPRIRAEESFKKQCFFTRLYHRKQELSGLSSCWDLRKRQAQPLWLEPRSPESVTVIISGISSCGMDSLLKYPHEQGGLKGIGLLLLVAGQKLLHSGLKEFLIFWFYRRLELISQVISRAAVSITPPPSLLPTQETLTTGKDKSWDLKV